LARWSWPSCTGVASAETKIPYNGGICVWHWITLTFYPQTTWNILKLLDLTDT
jgi:hypothetical protein